MSSRRRHEGYLKIDHSASPGLPIAGLGEGTVFEAPVVQCCHCGTFVMLRPERVRPRKHCVKCDAYVCDKAECQLECNPYKKKIDDAHALAHRNEQNERGLILITGA